MFSTADQYGHHFVARKNYATVEILVCEQALQGALAAGQEKEGELATTSLEFEFRFQFPVAPLRLSCQISTNQHEAEKSAKNTGQAL